MSEALILESVNSQYDENSPKNTSSEHVVYKYCFDCQNINNNFCTKHVLNSYVSGNSMNNFLSYCGLTDARLRASEKDLPGSDLKIGRRLDIFHKSQITLCLFVPY